MNLINILNQCIGCKFYTTIFGYVELTRIEKYIEDTYPIVITYRNYSNELCETYLTKRGCYSLNKDAECIIFPSKNQRDWKLFEKLLKERKKNSSCHSSFTGRKK